MIQTTLHPIINQDQLAKVAGEACFQKGVKDFKTLPINNFQHDHHSAHAIIDSYKVTITFLADRIEGSCNCQQSDGFDFCAHCVCLTLHANKMVQQIISLSKGPDKSKVLAFLLTQEKTSLAKQCLSLIESDPEQFERYLLRASLTKEHINYSELKSKLTDLTRKQENLFSQRQVKHYFNKIDRFIGELSLINLDDEPEKLIKVIEHTFLRINRSLSSIDDSSEQRKECIDSLRQLYTKLSSLINSRPETKAKRFYSLWIADQFDLLNPEISSTLNIESEKRFLLMIEKKWQQHLTNKAPDLLLWQQKKIIRFLFEQAMKVEDTDKMQTFRKLLT